MAQVVFFFGAGASAPFGIPTMQGMVRDFEATLNSAAKSQELKLYRDIASFLQANLGREVDLEAVFTIVDSIMNWSPDRLGVAALYHATRMASVSAGPARSSTRERIEPPSGNDIQVARSLESDFERFVQNACKIGEGQTERIESVHRDLFSKLGGFGASSAGPGNRYASGDWPMFTTNYDAILEHYWMDIVQVPLNTGFQYNSVARMEVSEPERFRQGGLRLFKLHGSITWLLDERWGLTEQRVPPQEMRTFTGRRFLGQVMLYPIEEKELYVEPYQTMYLMLNRELAQSARWVVVGYSFGDRIVRDIFVRNGQKTTVLIVVHPRADTIADRLAGFPGSLKPISARFGEDGYTHTNDLISRALRPA